MPLLNSIGRLLTLRRVSLWDFPSEPRPLVLLWLGAAVILNILASEDRYWFLSAGVPFAQLGGCIMAALLAAWLLGRRSETVRFAFGFMAIGLFYLLFRSLIVRIPAGPEARSWIILAAMGWSIAAALRLILSASGWVRMTVKIFSSVAVAAVLLPSLSWADLEPRLFTWMMPPESESRLPEIDEEALWTAQPALLAAATNRIGPGDGKRPRTFILTVGAAGMQQLFGREAGAAGKMLEQRFGAAGQAVTLSNASADLMRLPLANRTNLAGTLVAVARQYDPQRDLMVIYLTSHGSRSGELSTNLPNYTDLKPISAEFLGKALNDAGIDRRIVVVSACYSGTWIKPLASPDTIVLTASAADRTSFGCDDKRQYTEFGEAFIGGLTAGRSLGDSFAVMKRQLEAREVRAGTPQSLPQAFVGARMKGVWDAPR